LDWFLVKYASLKNQRALFAYILLQKSLKQPLGAFNTTKTVKAAILVGFLQNVSTSLYLGLSLIDKSNTVKQKQ
jgi:hypothetical protein